MESIQSVIHSLNLTVLVKICITLLITLVINSLVRSYVRVPKKLDTRRGRTYLSVVRNTLSVIIFGTALHFVFILLNFDVAPLLASAGIVGLVIGIGARSLIEDLIAGFFLLTQVTIGIGDYVSVGSNVEGTVEDIGFRTIILRSPNGPLIIVPNGQVKQVINYSRGRGISFVDFPIKVGQKVDTVMQILEKIIEEFKADKESNYPLYADSKVIGVHDVTVGNCISIRVKLVTSYPKKYTVEQQFRYTVVKALEKNNIQIA